MQDTVVKFITAKLAKEKGFKWACDKGFNPNTGEVMQSTLWFHLLKFESDRHIAAPTQSILQKWLRDIHYIHIQITINYNFSTFKVEVLNMKADELFFEEEFKLNQYKEGLEIGLQEALKII